MQSRRKLNVEVSDEFLLVLQEATEYMGLSAKDVTSHIVRALDCSKSGNFEQAGRILMGIVPNRNSIKLFNADEFSTLTRSNVLGYHAGEPKKMRENKQGLLIAGISLDETDSKTLLMSTFANFRLAKKTIKTKDIVVIYKSTNPVVIYEDVVWGSYQTEDLKTPSVTKYYIKSSKVTLLPLNKTMDFRVGGLLNGTLVPNVTRVRDCDTSDPVLSYLATHNRQKQAVQQPLDLMDMR